MKRRALGLISVFAHMSEESLESLIAIARLHYLERNAILHYEGELINYACFLARGKVELYKMDKNDNELFLCYVDDSAQGKRLINAFGDFVPYETAANVRGIRPSEIVIFELDKLHSLALNNIEISNALMREFMDKMIVFKNVVNFREIFDSASKVAYFLYTKLDYFNQMQRQIIARELNIKIETLSRILHKMFQQGIIAKNEHNEIYIKDPALFVNLYGNVKQHFSQDLINQKKM